MLPGGGLEKHQISGRGRFNARARSNVPSGLGRRVLRRLKPRSTTSGLRIVWTIAILWYEIGIFSWSVAWCNWPDEKLEGPSSAKAHVLLVADPQILDMHSYPDRGYLLSALSQVIVDLNLRKSWSAMRSWLLTRSVSSGAVESNETETEGKEAVVFLGDMMDNGRSAYTEDEYETYFNRFRSIFATDPSTKVYYIPGNHDVGLGASQSFSPQSKSRYIKHFGELNYRVTMANHSLVMLDAPGLVEEDYRRANAKTRFEDWVPKSGSAIDFVQKYASVGVEEPSVLFTHIPLFRPEKASCGPLRERGSIRRGVGFGYQNTLGRLTTQYLLKNIRPVAVFSGDDHDYCEYSHSIPLLSEGPNPEIFSVREVTVKSLSIAMGIQQPGFQLLSLVDPHSVPPNVPTTADRLCLLPDQMSIYLLRYLPLLILTIIALSISTLRKIQAASLGQPSDTSVDSDSNHAISPESSFNAGSISSARMPSSASGSRSGTGGAPTLRASSATFPPHTPDIGVYDSGTPSSASRPSSGLFSVPLNGMPFDEGHDIEDGLENLTLDARMSAYRSRGSHYFEDDEEGGVDSGVTVPLIGRIPWNRNRRRWMAWTWTFVIRGRPVRFTIGVPPLLEQVVIRLVNNLRWGRLTGRGRGQGSGKLSKKGYTGSEKSSRDETNPLTIFVLDFVTAAWLPVMLVFVINWYVMHS